MSIPATATPATPLERRILNLPLEPQWQLGRSGLMARMTVAVIVTVSIAVTVSGVAVPLLDGGYVVPSCIQSASSSHVHLDGRQIHVIVFLVGVAIVIYLDAANDGGVDGIRSSRQTNFDLRLFLILKLILQVIRVTRLPLFTYIHIHLAVPRSCTTVPYRTVSYRIVSYRIVSYRIVAVLLFDADSERVCCS